MAVEMSGLTGFHLKVIAMLAMAVDHVGAILFPEYLILRYIGRLAFPIFSFLLVEGFVHTRNLQRYILRLGLFALLSEIPYNLAFYGEIVCLEKQNVFFALCLGVATLYVILYMSHWWEKGICVFFAMWLAQTIRTDYGGFGIALIIWFYLMYEHKWFKLSGGALWNFYSGIGIQSYGALAMLPILCYNGRQGRRMKYFFYFFYPAHLLVLYLIKIWSGC